MPEGIVPSALNADVNAIRGGGEDGADVGVIEIAVVHVFTYCGECKHSGHIAVGQPTHEIEVVDMQVSEDATAARNELAVAGEVIARLHVQGIESPHFATLDPVMDGTDAGVVAALEANLQWGAVCLREVDECGRRLDSERDGLLAEHGLTEGNDLREHGVVGVGAHRDHIRVRNITVPHIPRHTHGTELGGDGASTIGRSIRDEDLVDSVVGHQILGAQVAHATGADDENAHGHLHNVLAWRSATLR